MNYFKNRDFILPFSLFVITVLTRIPFMSKYLYHWDSVQCALALEKYDVTVHQPHPPGFFLYVMLGRLFNLFIEDANTLFILISILFSGLTVVAIYYLGRELFHEKLGIIAAAIAITSPNMWFHGEIAFIYIVDSFFTTVIAFFCWKTYKGEHKYVWLAAIALGIAGGMRIYTLIFLFPLWIFSLKGMPPKKILASFVVLGIVCALWSVPMLHMTGGWNAYKEAYRELLIFTAVLGVERQSALMRLYSTPILKFVIYGVGAGIFILGLAAYDIIRRKQLTILSRKKIVFFLLWLLPSLLFYLWVGLHSGIPGYALIILPALFILTAASLEYFSNTLKQLTGRNFFTSMTLSIIVINICLFFFSNFQTSYREIRNHDRNLSIMIDAIMKFNSDNTAIFVEPYIFYGFRHFQYYLPDYRVYLVDIRIALSGEKRKMFWGLNKQTYISEEIKIPGNIDNFLIVTSDDIKDKVSKIKGAHINNLSKGEFLVSGPINLIIDYFPELQVRIQNRNTVNKATKEE
jgi:hypothetical protein